MKRQLETAETNRFECHLDSLNAAEFKDINWLESVSQRSTHCIAKEIHVATGDFYNTHKCPRCDNPVCGHIKCGHNHEKSIHGYGNKNSYRRLTFTAEELSQWKWLDNIQ